MPFLFVKSLVPVKCLATCVSQLSPSGHCFSLPPWPRNSMLTLRPVSVSYTDMTCSFLLVGQRTMFVGFRKYFFEMMLVEIFSKIFFEIKFTGMFSKFNVSKITRYTVSLSCEKLQLQHQSNWVLWQADRLADKMLLNLEIRKIIYQTNIGILERYSIIIVVPIHFSQLLFVQPVSLREFQRCINCERHCFLG